jgi:hypothetical protein
VKVTQELVSLDSLLMDKRLNWKEETCRTFWITRPECKQIESIWWTGASLLSGNLTKVETLVYEWKSENKLNENSLSLYIN